MKVLLTTTLLCTLTLFATDSRAGGDCFPDLPDPVLAWQRQRASVNIAVGIERQRIQDQKSGRQQIFRQPQLSNRALNAVLNLQMEILFTRICPKP